MLALITCVGVVCAASLGLLIVLFRMYDQLVLTPLIDYKSNRHHGGKGLQPSLRENTEKKIVATFDEILSNHNHKTFAGFDVGWLLLRRCIGGRQGGGFGLLRLIDGLNALGTGACATAAAVTTGTPSVTGTCNSVEPSFSPPRTMFGKRVEPSSLATSTTPSADFFNLL